MAKVLMVAEKPSLARSLAEILSRKKCRRRKSSCSACDVYEFEGVFPPEGQSAAFKMTSVCGHVMSIDFLPKYNKWDQVDPVSTTLDSRIARSFHYNVFLNWMGKLMRLCGSSGHCIIKE